MRHSWLALGTAVAVLAAAGCGTRKPVVSGIVTLDGQPLDGGIIEFFPVRGDGQTSAAFLGRDGRYRTEASPTEMKVVLHSNKVVGKRKLYDDVPDSPTQDILVEQLPPRYTDINRTELIFTVQQGENTKDFALTSDRKK